MKGQDFFAEIALRPPLSRMHPRMGQFLRDYLSGEKVVSFAGRQVINTQFPPYPSRAFDRLAEQFVAGGADRRLYSVTLAVTNRCGFRCWHCYNAGRSQQDMPLPALKRLAGQLQDLGAVMITLTGGEPLLRDDLERICRAFDERSCLVLGTTGWGLTARRAKALKASGLFAVGISLDSDAAEEHDRLRGRDGAFRAALDALASAGDAGLYPYVVTVARPELLERRRFMEFMAFAGRAGAREVHLLEPSATGRLAHKKGVVLPPALRRRILRYQGRIAAREDLPILSTFAYLESSSAFGCGAGLTHIYVDGSGELCPCNLVPLSFGNVTREPLPALLERMGRHFCRPRPACAGKTLARHIPVGPAPTRPRVSETICRNHLPRNHALPRFFRVRSQAVGQAGGKELRQAYDRIHDDYDDFWVRRAGRPVEALVRRLRLRGRENAFEAGCGSGFGTLLLAGRLKHGGNLLAVDLSEGMLQLARTRAESHGLGNVRFRAGDALKALSRASELDLVFTTWVLGYIELAPFFQAAARALREGGRLALVVHKDNSPREPMEIFASLVAEAPGVLRKRVAFDFPRDGDHLRRQLRQAGLRPERQWEGKVVFRYPTPEEVMEHLLKSGAGTVFYDAIAPARRAGLRRRFLDALRERHAPGRGYQVVHDYLACIAVKPVER